MLEDLSWLGIAWQPPIVTQSERLAGYRDAMRQLLAAGMAYPCTSSRREIAQMTEALRTLRAIGRSPAEVRAMFPSGSERAGAPPHPIPTRNSS